MWIHTPLWSASIVSHNRREDLMVVRFRTQQEIEAFIKSIDEYVQVDDLDQRRSFVYGLTPGPHDYPYRMHLRREYVMAALFYTIENIEYTNFKNAAKDEMPKGIVSRNRLQALMEMWGTMHHLGQTAWKQYEYCKGPAHPQPIHTPERLPINPEHGKVDE